MPGMYKEGDFDLAGFCVGIAEKDELDRVERVRCWGCFNCTSKFWSSLKWIFT